MNFRKGGSQEVWDRSSHKMISKVPICDLKHKQNAKLMYKALRSPCRKFRI